ncbi:MAG: hypothetical protein E6G48_07520 [Actinobacteria bacterium]|nr:MAG: hypothetical protein E6G48_07520 [Actinomycetota bacterium]
MARKPLRSQLNQIRAWVRQGRTDAWIAHQLDVPASELREFRRRHELSAEDEEAGDLELRDEIEAEIEQATRDEETAAEEESEKPEEESEEKPEAEDGEEAEGDRPRRRRRRRRGGGGRSGAAMQATFDHGADDGFGLWLDPAVEDDPVYSEHWAGHRQVEVTIEPDRIVIRRA